MNNPEFLRIPGGATTVADDRRELRRVAWAHASASERYLRSLLGDDAYESWDND